MEEMGVLREWFNRVDSECKGTITALQLQTALAHGNLNFSITVVQQMIRMHDFDRNGTMNFQEFASLNKFLYKVQKAFSSLSREGGGFLTPDGVTEALKTLGFSLDYPSLYTACESFDREKDGRFFLDSFMSLCVFLQSARNLFDSFDLSRRGKVTLDFNQFVYCAANCRI
ncbi:uncharacterized protein LOC144716982 [Wolffia australiana]